MRYRACSLSALNYAYTKTGTSATNFGNFTNITDRACSFWWIWCSTKWALNLWFSTIKGNKVSRAYNKWIVFIVVELEINCKQISKYKFRIRVWSIHHKMLNVLTSNAFSLVCSDALCIFLICSATSGRGPVNTDTQH